MTGWLIALPRYDAWPLVRLGWLLVLAALLLLVTVPLLVSGLLLARGVAATERAAVRVPALPSSASGGDQR